MKMILLGGFLGSGKTSFLIQLAKYLVGDNPENTSKVVIVENEIGEIGVDDKVLRNGGYQVEGMYSGCVCCTIAGELITNIYDIMKNLKPEWIIMEATGVAYPANIKENLVENLQLDCRICCVADAKRWMRLLGAMKHLIAEQLEEADVILINKIDTVDNIMLSEIDKSVKTFNDTAEVYHISASASIDESIFKAVLGNEDGS